jgi:hypothetical protein
MSSSSFLTITLFFSLSVSAYAIPEQPSLESVPSPALQIARRVASMENEKDLPSRAVWLGKKAAQNTRLAYEAQASRKTKKKRPN